MLPCSAVVLFNATGARRQAIAVTFWGNIVIVMFPKCYHAYRVYHAMRQGPSDRRQAVAVTFRGNIVTTMFPKCYHVYVATIQK